MKDVDKCKILTDTSTYCTDSTTQSQQLGIYSTLAVIISTPKSREQDKVAELNERVRNLAH